MGVTVRQLDGFIRQKVGVAGGGISLVGEVPTGAVDGTNNVFTLSGTPQVLFLFYNGLFMKQGVDADYTLSENTVVFSSPPEAGSILYAIWG
ncbi:MAG: hypothetical protein AB1330_01305 [Bacillota bacterium]